MGSFLIETIEERSGERCARKMGSFLFMMGMGVKQAGQLGSFLIIESWGWVWPDDWVRSMQIGLKAYCIGFVPLCGMGMDAPEEWVCSEKFDRLRIR